VRATDWVRIISGSFDEGGFRDVADLKVRVGIAEYPNASCPAQLGRWSLSWAPKWTASPPASLTYSCVDGGVNYAALESWTRNAGAESCKCDPVFSMPGVRATVSCK